MLEKNRRLEPTMNHEAPLIKRTPLKQVVIFIDEASRLAIEHIAVDIDIELDAVITDGKPNVFHRCSAERKRVA